MNWISQVAHIIRKDIRHLWWVFVSFYAMIAIGFFQMFRNYPIELRPGTLNPASDFLSTGPSILLIISAFAGIALLVQVDSPTRENIFWRTRPIRPSAMFMAKFSAVMIAFVGVIVAVTAAMLVAMKTDTTSAWRIIASVAYTSGLWAVAVVAGAVVTRDLRTMIAGVVIAFFLMILLGSMFDRLYRELPHFIQAFLLVVLVLLAIHHSVRLYLRQSQKRSTVARGLIASVLLIYASVSDGLLRSANVRPAPEIPAAVSLAFEQQSAIDEESILGLPLKFRTLVADSTRYDFVADGATAVLQNGKSEFLSLQSVGYNYDLHAVVAGALPWVGMNVRWLNSTPVEAIVSGRYPGPGQKKIADSILNHVAGLYVKGTVTRSRARVVASIPLEKNATAYHNGRRIRIVRFGIPEHVNGLLVDILSVPREREWMTVSNNPFTGEPLHFAIVNAERREALLLHPGFTYSPSPTFVIPQISMTRRRVAFDTARTRNFEKIPTSPEWYAGARLIVMEWIPDGVFRAEVTGKIR